MYGKERMLHYADKSLSDGKLVSGWLSSWPLSIFTNINFLYERRNLYFIFRQLERGSQELFLLVLICL